MTSPTTRRDLFGASAAMLLLASPAAGAAKAAELDRELLAACARYQSLEADYQRLSSIAGAGWEPEHEAAQAALDAMSDEYDDVILEVAETPARTPEGLQAKAAAVMAFHGNNPSNYGSGYPHQRMEWSLIVDVAGRAVE